MKRLSVSGMFKRTVLLNMSSSTAEHGFSLGHLEWMTILSGLGKRYDFEEVDRLVIGEDGSRGQDMEEDGIFYRLGNNMECVLYINIPFRFTLATH